MGPMEKNREKNRLEKQSMEEKLKILREKSTGQKANEAFGLGKRNVKIVSKKLDNLDPPMTKEQQKNQANCDAFLDELNALSAKLNAEEAEKKNAEKILANKKSLFPPWSI
ncbi:unnamed protein product [Lactuca saligna]|uniref:Uncharacterized protein n=1 Tax=Lactuca saligna TaxID=75948 RepID=A0AA35VPT7_LACSI|nr:unnamed protein product [Lactuca saligna]